MAEVKEHKVEAAKPNAAMKPLSSEDIRVLEEKHAKEYADRQAAALKKAHTPLKVTKAVDSPTVMAVGAYDQFIGELWPGATGWLPLDVNGTPSGPATLLPPDPPVVACHVFANYMPNADADMLVTITGAPITDNMQPNNDIRFNPVYTPPVTMAAMGKERHA
jgi:hypothetical protein